MYEGVRDQNMLKALSLIFLLSCLYSNSLCSLLFASAVIPMSTAPTEDHHEHEDIDERRFLCGGIYEVKGWENSSEIEELARFAVDEHNKKENALLKFHRLVKAREQVVAGTLHHFTMEVIESGNRKLYEAKVWVQLWLNARGLHEFKLVGDAEGGDDEAGGSAVPAVDAVVKDAEHDEKNDA